MDANAILVSCDQVYARHPRPRWAGKVMAFFKGHSLDGLGNSARLEGRVGNRQLSVAVAEIPVMRLPAGFHAVAILDLKAAELFNDETHEIEAELKRASGAPS